MTKRPGDKRRTARRAVLAAGWSTGLACAASLGVAPAWAARPRPVRVLSTTDRPVVQPLIDDFELRHPRLRVDYVQLGSVALVQHFLGAGAGTADVLWSSAMDLQIKLVNDGYAARHESPHAAQLPRWAVWKHEAYATTWEPAGVAYHRGQWADAELPRTHAALAAQLLADRPRFDGRVATYDIERAGLGYLLAAHDALVWPGAWRLTEALAACRASLFDNTHDMLEGVGVGRKLLACNVLGTYVEAYARSQPALAVLYPADYTLIASRVAFVARDAPHPDGARQWLDHLLSPAGQRVLADECRLYPVRTDIAATRSGAVLQRELGAAARPIALGPGLLAPLDRSRHAAFVKRWRRVFEAAR